MNTIRIYETDSHARRLQALVGDEDPDLAELLSEVVARLEVSTCGERS